MSLDNYPTGGEDQGGGVGVRRGIEEDAGREGFDGGCRGDVDEGWEEEVGEGGVRIERRE